MRFPLIPTIIVAVAVAGMVALGFWQLSRGAEKEATIGALEANFAKPAISYPELAPLPRDLWFRKSAVTCLSVEGWQEEAGKAEDGSTGFRYIAECRTGAEGPGARVAIGVAGRPGLTPDWDGGHVTGRVVPARDERPFLQRITGRGVGPGPLLLSDSGLGGLQPPATPSPEALPNNHLSYAVQWFLFALMAAIIYPLALRYKRKGRGDTPSES